MKNYLFLLSALLLLPACSEQVSIEGSWVEPVPGMPDMQQGFTLEANGKASSIEMATLQYESWKKEGNQLILSGKSIGNHLTIDFSDTLTIEKLTADSLILKRGEVVCTYTRAQEIQTKYTGRYTYSSQTDTHSQRRIGHCTRSTGFYGYR